MKMKMADVVRLFQLELTLYEEEDDDCPNYRAIVNKERAIGKRLDKYTSDNEIRGKIREIMRHYIWDTKDNTYKPICDDLRTLGIEVEG